MKGKTPKPEQLRGKEAKRIRPTTEPKIEKRKMLAIPKEASERGKWLYQKLSAAGVSDHILAEVDSPALVLYCETWSKWFEANQKSEPAVYKTKSGNVAVNPQVWIANALAKTLVKLASELGMTPVGRAKMAIELLNAESDWDEFVKQKRERLAEIGKHIIEENEDRDMAN